MTPLRLVIDPSGRGQLYAHGILVPGLKSAVAHPGAGVMLVVDPAFIVVERPPAAAAEQDNQPRRLAYPTDGQA